MSLTTTQIRKKFTTTRQYSEHLCAPLAIEDFVVQPVDFVSPPKWHLGHTTWFFETFILKKYFPDYQCFDEQFAFLFNSYYESVGAHWVRSDRGNLSRPSVERIKDYRHYVTEAMQKLMDDKLSEDVKLLVEIGINHEQQHQELLLTDIKYILGTNPLLPIYDQNFVENPRLSAPSESLNWIAQSEGIYQIGVSSDSAQFCYDNEMDQHKVYLQAYQLANRLVTNGEYLEFMDAGGYEQVLLWHADAWAWLTETKINKPLYWYQTDEGWQCYTLSGLQPLDLEASVTHLSYYEAFAFAQWSGCRLPTEAEWEVLNKKLHWGSRWEWTESAYLPYPGYHKPTGAIGEYNGKFMVNQKVLRGSSVATPKGHSRPTYRNFFQPPMRWQFNGIRLAK